MNCLETSNAQLAQPTKAIKCPRTDGLEVIASDRTGIPGNMSTTGASHPATAHRPEVLQNSRTGNEAEGSGSSQNRFTPELKMGTLKGVDDGLLDEVQAHLEGRAIRYSNLKANDICFVRVGCKYRVRGAHFLEMESSKKMLYCPLCKKAVEEDLRQQLVSHPQCVEQILAKKGKLKGDPTAPPAE